ncbi:MAG: methyl-accepting chemotaxis protein, partial [Chromatiales bacterium]|nr:methyl-accepting chemotaxis protein [Chromatiales bacterium]
MATGLKSREMSLSGAERRWLPWFGKTGKLAMGWACRLNRGNYGRVERTFEGIAQTRKRLLEHWAEGHWEFLANLAGLLAEHFPDIDPRLLADKKQQAPEYTELFVIDPTGRVLASTHDKHVGKTDLAPNAVARGLKGRFLHGPYVDALTRDLGPGTSRFHDAVTLMFYHPLVRDGVTLGCLCGRIPNDVMGDLIQREAGHVYKESGDNYVFMVESRFDPSIRPGTALSRSRSED